MLPDSSSSATGTLDAIGQQDHAVTSEYRIFGPPGAGKTTNVTRQIWRAVNRYGPEGVLVTSFSRTAAAELAGRDLPIAKDRVGTLHSHCWHALGGPEIAESQVDEWNRDNPHLTITPVKKHGKLDNEESAEENDGATAKVGDELLQQLGRFRGMMCDRRLWPATLIEFERRWTEYKRENGLLDFTDLIDVCLRDVHAAPRAPSVIFADEAQDLNAMQLSLVRKWGSRAEYFIIAGDDDQCQPAGTMVRTTEGEVPIESLDPAHHRLVAYAPKDAAVYGSEGRGFAFRKASRRHDWWMHHIQAGGHTTHCTPEHKFFVRWQKGESLDRAHVVYLMQRGDRFRVGWCKLMRRDGIFHLGHRARIERADGAWVLKVFFDRTDASIYESYVAAKYGLPLATFEPVNGTPHYTTESLNRLFQMLRTELPLRAVQCLLDHSRDPRFPLYSPARAFAKRGGSTMFLTEAANLLPSLMTVPIPNASRGVDWAPLTIENSHYRGLVYSLDVDVHHTYIADGIATHNCIYSFTGATPDAFLDPDIPDDHKIILKQSYRVPRAVHGLADKLIHQVGRRQEKVYLPRAEQGEVVRLTYGTYQSPDAFILNSAMEHLERGRSVMFLTACSYMLKPLVSALRKNAVPFHNPYRKSNGSWNPMRFGKGGSTPSRILSLLVAHPDYGVDHRPWTHGDLALWADWLRSKGILKHGAKKRLTAYTAESEANYERLEEIFETGALESLVEAYGRGSVELLDWWRSRVTADVHQRVQFPVEIAARRGAQALFETPRVVVGTIHSVKGGQADVVYLFPDLSQAGDAQYRRDGAPHDSVIRVFYVGATRARETLYICQRASGMAVTL